MGTCGCYVYGSSDRHLDPRNQCDHAAFVPYVVAMWLGFFAVALALALAVWRAKRHHARRLLLLPASSSAASRLRTPLLEGGDASCGTTRALTPQLQQEGEGEAEGGAGAGGQQHPEEVAGTAVGAPHGARPAAGWRQGVRDGDGPAQPSPAVWLDARMVVPLALLVVDVGTDARLLALW